MVSLKLTSSERCNEPEPKFSIIYQQTDGPISAEVIVRFTHGLLRTQNWQIRSEDELRAQAIGAARDAIELWGLRLLPGETKASLNVTLGLSERQGIYSKGPVYSQSYIGGAVLVEANVGHLGGGEGCI